MPNFSQPCRSQPRRPAGAAVTIALAVLFAAVAAGSFAPPATAAAMQEQCRQPDPPRIPRGASVQRREMEDAQRAADDYFHAVRIYVDCLERAIRSANESADKVEQELTRQTDIYNSQ